jgi:hypothetical protein
MYSQSSGSAAAHSMPPSPDDGGAALVPARPSPAPAAPLQQLSARPAPAVHVPPALVPARPSPAPAAPLQRLSAMPAPAVVHVPPGHHVIASNMSPSNRDAFRRFMQRKHARSEGVVALPSEQPAPVASASWIQRQQAEAPDSDPTALAKRYLQSCEGTSAAPSVHLTAAARQDVEALERAAAEATVCEAQARAQAAYSSMESAALSVVVEPPRIAFPTGSASGEAGAEPAAAAAKAAAAAEESEAVEVCGDEGGPSAVEAMVAAEEAAVRVTAAGEAEAEEESEAVEAAEATSIDEGAPSTVEGLVTAEEAAVRVTAAEEADASMAEEAEEAFVVGGEVTEAAAEVAETLVEMDVEAQMEESHDAALAEEAANFGMSIEELLHEMAAAKQREERIQEEALKAEEAFAAFMRREQGSMAAAATRATGVSNARVGSSGASAVQPIITSDVSDSSPSADGEQDEVTAASGQRGRGRASGPASGQLGRGRASGRGAHEQSRARGRTRRPQILREPSSSDDSPERAAPASQRAAGKQPVRGESASANSRAMKPAKSGASGSTSRTEAAASTPASTPSAKTFAVGQEVRARYWRDNPEDLDEQPTVRSWPFPGKITAVSTTEAVVDVKYDDYVLVQRVPVEYVLLRRSREEDAAPLIDLIQKKNKERNAKLFESLGLGEPLIPLHSPVRRKVRQPAASAADNQAASRRSRSQAGLVVDALASYYLGFDFGFAESLLAFQTIELSDLFSECYGQERAKELLASLCVVPSRSDGGAAGSSSSIGGNLQSGGSSVGGERPLCLVIFARVGFHVMGAAVVRFHLASDPVTPGQQLLELLLVSVAPSAHGQGIAQALYSYAPSQHKPMHRCFTCLS